MTMTSLWRHHNEFLFPFLAQKQNRKLDLPAVQANPISCFVFGNEATCFVFGNEATCFVFGNEATLQEYPIALD